MQQNIGDTKITAWVEHITRSLTPQARKTKELDTLTGKPHSLLGPGEPLDIAARRRMEAFFGYDLGDVRIHRGYRAGEASRRLSARAFTFRGHVFGSRQNLDGSTREGLGLLAHELTHAIQQIHSYRLPQGETANQDTNLALASPPGSNYGAGMVLLAPAKGAALTTNSQQREAQAQANEQLVTEGLADNKPKSTPQINPEEVASKVYRLMQYDLVLERERATRLGG